MVHNAFVDACEEVTDDTTLSPEEQHYINMADADGFDEIDEASEGADDAGHESEPADVNVNEETISALVAAGLGNLLKD